MDHKLFFINSFPSGTNRDDYLIWICDQMNVSVDNVTIYDADEEDVTTAQEVVPDCSDNVDKANIDVKTIREDYFKGYFAFALWGCIQPTDEEKYQTAFIGTAVKFNPKIKVEQGCKSQREDKKIDESVMSKLDEHDVKKIKKEESENLGGLTGITMKVRKDRENLNFVKVGLIRLSLR